MTSQPLVELRKVVLDIYDNRYSKIREKFSSDNDDQLLIKRVELLRDDKFLLAVVGESKSGKSKFINGLIGKELLPTDVLQCTSGIVEIFKSDKPSIKVIYAGGNEDLKTYIDNSESTIDKLRAYLEKLAAIPEDYRNIPFIQINDFLIQNKGQQIENKEVDKNIKEVWDKDGGRLFGIGKNKNSDLIYKYIREYRDLTKIPESIRVGYPLEFDFKSMSIVDTPGVNAIGGIQDVTYKYIDGANAVVFIHTIKNIDSESLRNFFKKHLPKKNAKSIFLFLTHKSLHTAEDVKKTVEQAKSNFAEIDPQRITVVDSMLKLIYHDLENGKTTDDILENEEKEKIIAKYLLPQKRVGQEKKQLMTDEEIKQALIEDSNFREVVKILSDFSNQARKIQIEEITDIIFKNYTSYEASLKEDIELRESKITKSAEAFEVEINAIQEELEKYKNNLNGFSKTLIEKYKYRNSNIAIGGSNFKKDYDKKLDNANDLSETRKILIDIETDFNDFIEKYAKEINLAYSEEMAKMGAEIQGKQITPPKIDLPSIESKAKEGAYETVPNAFLQAVAPFADEIVGVVAGAANGVFKMLSNWSSKKALTDGLDTAFKTWYKMGKNAKVGKAIVDIIPPNQTVLNEGKVVNNLKQAGKALLDTYTDQLHITLKEFVDLYDEDFRKQLSKVIEDRNKAYDELLEQKKNEAQIRKDIEGFESRLKEIREAVITLKESMNPSS